MSSLSVADDLYCQIPEPEPDYSLDDISDDFPPPPSPLTLQAHQCNEENNNNNNNSNNDNFNNDNSATRPDVTGYPAHGAGPVQEETRETSLARRVLPHGAMSREKEAMHRELLMNQKRGRDVLQKGELSRVLAERKATQKRKEWQQQQASKRTSLELKLEKRAHQLNQDQGQEERMQKITEGEVTSELAQIHRRITRKGFTPSPTT
ncbi:hypothetical protein ACOMHN_061201 [Nucella lapillus]